MEEICGNIEDEHDTQKLIARRSSRESMNSPGRCEIAEINDRFHLDIPEDDSYQTLAGYILTTTGSIPGSGPDSRCRTIPFRYPEKKRQPPGAYQSQHTRTRTTMNDTLRFIFSAITAGAYA